MTKIQEFFQNELKSCNENKVKIENEIRRANLDIQFVTKTKKKIISEIDNTYDVFYANDNDTTFNSREISSLKLKEDDLTKLIIAKSNELEQIENRINYINEMISECNKFNYKEKNSIPEVNILQIQEAERQRIARDIHDSIVQNLTVLIHKSEFAMKIMDSDILRSKLELSVINKVVRECINELREIISDLRPMSLDDLGMEVTLKRMISQIESTTDMVIYYEYNINENVDVKPIISITVLRIIKELCSNAIKYSEGNNINIQISIKEKSLYICFEDDGIGFSGFADKSVLKNNSGFGLPILKDRIKLLGGCIKFSENMKNTGTRYDIEIPLYNEER